MNKVYICPTDKWRCCPWEGDMDDIYDHFMSDHDDLLYDSNEINLNLNVTSDNILLMHGEEIYLVQYRIQDDVLYINLRFLGLPEIAKQMRYNISFENNAEYLRDSLCMISREGRWEINLRQMPIEGLSSIACKFEINKSCIVDGQSTEHSDSSDTTVVVEGKPRIVRKNHSYNYGYMRKSPLNRSTRHKSVIIGRNERKKLNRLSSVDIVLHSSDETIDIPDTSETILNPEDFSEENLKCCTCEKIMLPPIYLCTNDHSTCSTCKGRLCKLCDSPITNTRNEALEHISRNFLYSCRYTSEGCDEKLRYNQLLEHEIRCSFCTYSCPIEECPTKGTMNIIKDHIAIFHKGVKVSTSLQNDCPRGSQFFVINPQKGVFYCTCTMVDEFIEWQVIFCGPKERQFFCEIYFKNHKSEKIYLKRNMEKYTVKKHLSDLKKLKVKDKHAVLQITSYD